jgi:glutamate carboxypeptidase
MDIQAAHRWLEQQQALMTAELIDLCNLNSGSHHLDGLNRVASRLESWMDLAPAVATRILLPPREAIDDRGVRRSEMTSPMLRWDFRPECSRRVLLAIHYDTVFEADSPFQQCERLNANRLRGPGVADAKGGIVVLRFALQALLRYQLAPDLGWTVLLNPDEEIGSPSSAPVFREFAPEFDFGLLFEPALANGGLVSQRKGSGNFTVIVRGRSSHAGRHFEAGRNALAELSRIVAALDGLNGSRAGTTINVGCMKGGGAVNVVPDFGIARLNVRVSDESSSAWFLQKLEEFVRETSVREGFTAEFHGGFFSPPKLSNELQQELMWCIERAAARIGQAIHWESTGGVCDGNKLAAAGLPNIDTLGPLGDGLHSHLETVELATLVDKAKLLVEILCDFAGGGFPNLHRNQRMG